MGMSEEEIFRKLMEEDWSPMDDGVSLEDAVTYLHMSLEKVQEWAVHAMEHIDHPAYSDIWPNELDSVALEMGAMIMAMHQLHYLLMQKLLTEEQLKGVLAHKLQEALGHPIDDVQRVRIGDMNGYAITFEHVEVPDDLSGLGKDGEGEG